MRIRDGVAKSRHISRPLEMLEMEVAGMINGDTVLRHN